MDDLTNLVNSIKAQDEPASPEPEETTGDTDEPVEVQESEEVESEESEEIESDDDDQETDEQGEESDPDEEWHTIKVGGEEIQVTLDEALKGYQRDKDYRQKTMQLAEDKKAIEAEKAKIADLIQQVDSFVLHQEENIDWDELREDDPAGYINAKEKLEKAKSVREQAAKEQQAMLADYIQKQTQSLVEVMGGDEGWNQEQRSVDMKLASDYLQKKGLKDEDISQIYDHRLWTIIFDAAKSEKYKETEAKVKEQVRKAPKSVKPGQKIAPSERKKREATKRIQGARTRQEGISALADLLKQLEVTNNGTTYKFFQLV